MSKVGEEIACPGYGGSTGWNQHRTRLLWHREWRIGPGGKPRQASVLCTGSTS